jgi:hypothetical protein
MAALIKFAAKCGIAGGIVYGVASQYIFSSQDRAITSFRQLKSKTQTNVPVDLPEVSYNYDDVIGVISTQISLVNNFFKSLSLLLSLSLCYLLVCYCL